ncbi:MAG: helix-turn-helix domain-containing protein [Nitrospinales bacterium]
MSTIITENNKSFFNRLVLARKNSKINQNSLADKLGIAISTMNKYEKGEWSPKVELVYQIAEILNCDPGWLITGNDPKEIDRRIKSEYYSDIPNDQKEDDMYLQKYVERLEKDVVRLEEQNLKLMALLEEQHLPGKKKKVGRG